MPPFAALSMALALLIATAAPAHALNWHTHIVDVGESLGLFNGIAIDSKGYAHISYSDAEIKVLKYITNESGVWVSTIVDQSTETGMVNSIAVDPNDGLHISYRDRNGDLKYASKPAGAAGWQTETVDVAVPLVWVGSTLYQRIWNSSIAVSPLLDARGGYQPYICFPAHVADLVSHLKVAHKANGTWQVDTVDDSNTRTGRGCSLAFDKDANIHIAYVNNPKAFGTEFLKHAFYDAAQQQWSYAIIDDTENAWPSAVSLAVAPDAAAHVAYNRWEKVMYANNVGGSWQFQVVLPGGDPHTTSIKIGTDNVKQIAFDISQKPQVLAYMRFIPDAPKDPDIFVETVDDKGKYHYCNMALDAGARPHISHYSILADPVDGEHQEPNSLKYSHTFTWYPW